MKKCDDRDKLLKELRRETDPLRVEVLRREYKVLRNRVTEEKKRSKKSFFSRKFAENKNRSSDVWKSIRSLVNIKPKKASSIKLMDGDGSVVSDHTKIANIFNDHFSTLGSKVQQRIPPQDGDYKSYLNRRDEDGRPYINPNGCSFFLAPTVPAEVSKIIDSLDVGKSTGPVGIPVFLLKIFKEFLLLAC